jgi:HemY protein
VKYLIIALASLLVAVVLGHFISDDAGFVVIGYAGKVFRTSFAFFVVLIVVGATALHFAWRFVYQVFTLKTRWLGWTGEYRRKRSQRALSNGLIALAEGDFNRAERLLSRGADDESAQAIRYLGAAEAAQAQNASDRRDTYLSLAHEAMPSAEVAIGIKRAEMELANRQNEQARATLDYLADRHPDNKQVLGLQQRVYTRTGDARALLGLLPALRRHRVYAPERLGELELEAAVELLSHPFSSLDELHEIWHRLPKATRGQPACVAPYTQQLAALGYQEEAENLLRKTLARHWDGSLVRQYGDVRIPDVALQLQRAEAWLVTRTDDPDTLLTLAKLSVAAENWSSAHAHLDRLIELAPSPTAYRLLAEVHEQEQDVEAANRCQREGLRLATNAVGGLPALRA